MKSKQTGWENWKRDIEIRRDKAAQDLGRDYSDAIFTRFSDVSSWKPYPRDNKFQQIRDRFRRWLGYKILGDLRYEDDYYED